MISNQKVVNYKVSWLNRVVWDITNTITKSQKFVRSIIYVIQIYIHIYEHSCSPLRIKEEPTTLLADPTFLAAEQGPRLPCCPSGDVIAAFASTMPILARHRMAGHRRQTSKPRCMWHHQVILQRHHGLMAAPCSLRVLPRRVLRRRARFVAFNLLQQPLGFGVVGGTAVGTVHHKRENIRRHFMP